MLEEKETHVAGDVGVSAGGEDRDGVAPNLELLGFGLLPVVLVTVLKRQSRENEKISTKSKMAAVVSWERRSHVAEVEGVDSGLDKEGIVGGQAVLKLGVLVLRFVVQLE